MKYTKCENRTVSLLDHHINHITGASYHQMPQSNIRIQISYDAELIQSVLEYCYLALQFLTTWHIYRTDRNNNNLQCFYILSDKLTLQTNTIVIIRMHESYLKFIKWPGKNIQLNVQRINETNTCYILYIIYYRRQSLHTSLSFIVGLVTHQYILPSSTMDASVNACTDSSSWNSRKQYPITQTNQTALNEYFSFFYDALQYLSLTCAVC